MGQHRQSQSNDEKNTADEQGEKQQKADPDKSSSRTSGSRQQQQDQDAGRSQQGGSNVNAPRAGGRDSDNPSESANQEDRRTTSGKGEH